MQTTNEMQYAKWLFLGPALIHVWWAKCVLSSRTELKTTGLFDFYLYANHNIAVVGWLMLLIGVMAIVSIPLHAKSPFGSLLLLMPQQIAMVISAYKAGGCIVAGTYADGAAYDTNFISADQCYIFVIGIVHSCLIVHVYVWEGIRRVWKHS